MPAFEVEAGDRFLALLTKPHVLAAARNAMEMQPYIEYMALKN
jgi:hypothetical protein